MSAISYGMPQVAGYGKVVGYHWNPSTLAYEVNTEVTGGVIVANSLIPAVYDYMSLSMTGSDLTGVVYKTGGSGGTTVATLTIAYDGSHNITSVTRT